MTEYTPSTANIGIAWEDWMNLLGKPHRRARDEFDRWLNQVKAEAWQEGYNKCDSDYGARYFDPDARNPYIERRDDD